MEKSDMKSHHAESCSKSTTLLIERLEQLGYQCQSERCDRFTTLRIRPMDEKGKNHGSGTRDFFKNQSTEIYN